MVSPELIRRGASQARWSGKGNMIEPAESSKLPKTLGYFPFQQLPLELRIMVHPYPIPDKVVPEYRNPTARIRRGRLYKSLRYDGGRCYPTILQTAKSIYAEAINEFYGKAIFRVFVRSDSYMFASSKRSVSSMAPRTLEHIRSLHLILKLPQVSELRLPGYTARQRIIYAHHLKNTLRVIRSGLGVSGRLHTLVVILLKLSEERQQETLIYSLRWTLSPLFGIQGLRNAVVVKENGFNQHDPSGKMAGPEQGHALQTTSKMFRNSTYPAPKSHEDFLKVLFKFNRWIKSIADPVNLQKNDREILACRMIDALEAHDKEKREEFKQVVTDTLEDLRAIMEKQIKERQVELGNLWSAVSQLTSLTQDDKPRTVFARESKNKAVIANLMKAQSSILDLQIVSRGTPLDSEDQQRHANRILWRSEGIQAQMEVCLELWKEWEISAKAILDSFPEQHKSNLHSGSSSESSFNEV